jgi:DNA helicase-2/ATP-dependent DNA helicase PcrA
LIISYSLSDDKGKNTLRAAYLLNSVWHTKKIDVNDNIENQIELAELDWYKPIVDPISPDMKDLLLPVLENYKLSVTHLNTFLDVTRGGPHNFLLQNLLRFPQAKTPNATYGTAIHETLRMAHNHIVATKEPEAIEDIIAKFETNLKDEHLSEHDFKHLLQKGGDDLRIFFESTYTSFSPNQIAELDFRSQNSILDSAHISGKLDVVEIDKVNKSIKITDYKTGKPSMGWNGKTDYEKIKLHKYRQQLMFYKLLIENSRDYHGLDVESACITFIEPTRSKEISRLEIDFDKGEIERFKSLINIIWNKIKKLELPDTEGYDKSYKGILQFEEDLLDKVV